MALTLARPVAPCRGSLISTTLVNWNQTLSRISQNMCFYGVWNPDSWVIRIERLNGNKLTSWARDTCRSRAVKEAFTADMSMTLFHIIFFSESFDSNSTHDSQWLSKHWDSNQLRRKMAFRNSIQIDSWLKKPFITLIPINSRLKYALYSIYMWSSLFSKFVPFHLTWCDLFLGSRLKWCLPTWYELF